MFLHAVRHFVNQKVFSSKHVSTFLTRKYDVVSQLHHSYAKGRFCVTRLKCFKIIVLANDDNDNDMTMTMIMTMTMTMAMTNDNDTGLYS